MSNLFGKNISNYCTGLTVIFNKVFPLNQVWACLCINCVKGVSVLNLEKKKKAQFGDRAQFTNEFPSRSTASQREFVQT